MRKYTDFDDGFNPASRLGADAYGVINDNDFDTAGIYEALRETDFD